ncbi:unnamed protein product [marine sediment metagenome]|uniref:Uncharacterized protein n=1 Tax=marine sediment metagenome TaxID=412755 RepID=X1QSE0_9ZZZZ
MKIILNANKCSDWLPLVDMFRTFYFDEFIGLKDKLEIIKSNFVFT